MKENVFDQATDILKERMNLAMGELKKQYKTANPYRQEPVSEKQQVAEFLQKTPSQIQFARQQFGGEAVDSYIGKMRDLIMRRMK